MAISTLTTKGQVTIPVEIRKRMNLAVGDRLDFRLDAHGRLLVQPETRPGPERIFGMLSRYAKDRPVSVEEMNAAIRARAAKKHGRPKK